MDTPQERLEYFISKFFQSKTDFAKVLGVTLPNLNKYLGKEGSILGASYHTKMIELNLNPTWYTTGQGNMLWKDEKNEKEKTPFSWLTSDAQNELDSILNIKLYLTPEAKMGQALSFNDIPTTITTFRNYIAPNARNISAIIARGDSMIEDGIEDGDLVFFEAGAMPRNKQIIVAEYNDSVLIKRYVKKDDESVWLESSNTKFSPLQIKDAEHFKIIGVFRGFYRNPFM